MLLALLLLVVQSLAPQPAAALTAAGSAAHARGAGYGAAVATAGARAPHVAERSVRGQEQRHAAVWLRAPGTVVHVAPSRVTTVPPTLPSTDASAARLSIEAAFAASVRVRALEDSHHVSGRGALLPYYPTAPPLQG